MIHKIDFKKLNTKRLLAYYRTFRGNLFYYDDELRAYKKEVKAELDTRPHIHGDNHITHKTRQGKKVGEECTCVSHPCAPHFCVYDQEIDETGKTCTCCPFCTERCAEDI